MKYWYRGTTRQGQNQTGTTSSTPERLVRFAMGRRWTRLEVRRGGAGGALVGEIYHEDSDRFQAARWWFEKAEDS